MKLCAAGHRGGGARGPLELCALIVTKGEGMRSKGIGFSWRLLPVVGSPTLALILLLAATSWCSSVEIECGFDGCVKKGKWFPVHVRGITNATCFTVYVMQQDWCARKPRPLSRTIGTLPLPSGDSATVLCKFGERYGSEEFIIRCEIPRPANRKEIKDAKPKILSDEDLLAIAISDVPDMFDFLGSIRLTERGIVRVYQCPQENFPARWQELDCVDVVILDSSESPKFTPAQRAALSNWLVAGGMIVLTDRGLLLGKEKGTWGFFPEVNVSAEYRTVSHTQLAGFLGKYGAFLKGVKSLHLQVPEKNRVLWTDDTALIAARDTGCGRVLAVGIDWQRLELKDRAFYESVRKDLWAGVLALRRPAMLQNVPKELVTPKEAKAKFLAWYLTVFLLVYIVILGPTNWLILRWLKRMEYSIITIPAGAVVFSVLAFAIGVSLRSRDTLLCEAEVLTAQDSTAGYASGATGILSPDRKPYELALSGESGVVDKYVDQFRGWAEAPRLKDMLVYSFDREPRIRNVKIGTWAMRFFSTRTVEELGGGVSFHVTCDKSGLHGEIRNHLPFTLRDTHIFHRWNRISLGNLPAGASTNFTLPLITASREIFPKCPNCHRFHGREAWFSESFCKKYPISEELRTFAQSISGLLEHCPTLVGWHDVSESYVKLDREVVKAERKRLCVFPIDLHFEGPQLLVPEGLVRGKSSRRPRDGRLPLFVSDIRCQGLQRADVETAKAEMQMYCLPGFCFGEYMIPETENECREATYEFYLPFRGEDVATASFSVHWDAGEPDPDHPPVESILSAYDWTEKKWVELKKTESGEHKIDPAKRERFVGLPQGMVLLKIGAVGTDSEGKPRSGTVNFLEISYEGRKEAPR